MITILRTDEQKFDRNAAARALAPCLNKSPVDLMRQLSAWPGILAEGLDAATASSCTKALQDIGLNVKAVPKEVVAGLPQPMVLGSCELVEEGMRYSHQQLKHTLPWPKVRWIDMADVGFEEISQSAAEDYLSGDSEGSLLLPRRRTETKWYPRIDIVIGKQMETLLRLDLNRFKFHSTGLKVHPSRRQNIWALCIALATRAKSAECGPGVRWVTEGGVPEQQRVRSDEAYNNLLRWRLTLLSELEGSLEPATSEHLDSASGRPDDEVQRITQLVELCQAILEDGTVSYHEVKDLHRWLNKNRDSENSVVKFLTDVMKKIMADGFVTFAERRELKAVLGRIISEADD